MNVVLGAIGRCPSSRGGCCRGNKSSKQVMHLYLALRSWTLTIEIPAVKFVSLHFLPIYLHVPNPTSSNNYMYPI